MRFIRSLFQTIFCLNIFTFSNRSLEIIKCSFIFKNVYIFMFKQNIIMKNDHILTEIANRLVKKIDKDKLKKECFVRSHEPELYLDFESYYLCRQNFICK